MPRPILLLIFLLSFCSFFSLVASVHSHHFIKKAGQRRIDAENELEEELDSDAEEEALVERIISLSNAGHNRPLMANEQQEGEQMQNQDTLFEQGESRDFLHFLRRIHYDHRQCPPQTKGQPVLISVSVVISNIRAVSEVTMDYSLEMFYRESWLDERLRYDILEFKNKSELALHESYANFLWHPDTFMPNAIASKNPRKHSISHRSLLRLQADGQILYSRRLSVVAECPMDLTLFPFDSQTCKLGIESYGYTSEEVKYGWSHGKRAALKLHKIRLPDFRIKEAFVTSQMESYATGNYSRLYVCFIFSRSAGFCFLQLIIPSTAVVISSWISLWMENETSFQDMISIILTITFLLFSYNEVMPRVSYLKALDIWLAVCFLLVFLSLIKLAIMKYMRQRLKLEIDKNQHPLLANMLHPFINADSLVKHPIKPFRPSAADRTLSFRGKSSNPSKIRPPTPPPHLRTISNGQRQSPSERVRKIRHSPPSAAGSCTDEDGRRRRSTMVSNGLEAILGPMSQFAVAVGRKGSIGGSSMGTGSGLIAPYQLPISTLAATSLNLPLSQSSLRQLRQHQLFQLQQQLQFQSVLENSELLHQAQMQALREQQRKRRKERERRQRADKRRKEVMVDANKNKISARPSPITSIRIGIEESSGNSSENDSDASHSETNVDKNRFFCFDQFGNVEFSAQFMRRFHWLSQMSFFFGFVLFCLYFFLVYPNSRSTAIDPACRREDVEWFASIPT